MNARTVAAMGMGPLYLMFTAVGGLILYSPEMIESMGANWLAYGLSMFGLGCLGLLGCLAIIASAMSGNDVGDVPAFGRTVWWLLAAQALWTLVWASVHFMLAVNQ
jgi:hypothetical protein